MTTIADAPADLLTEWLLHVRPVGLVIGPNILREEELVPPRQSALDTEAVKAILSTDVDDEGPVLSDPWAFFSNVLGWDARFVAGAPGGPDLPESLAIKVPEHDLTLMPDWAVRELGAVGGYQLLVKLHLDADADQRGALEGWEASPHRQFERLLRDGPIPIGVLVDRAHLRVVYAPRGETSGWISFPLRSLATVAGRPMLGGLKLMLRHARLFTEPEHLRLPKLLVRSREAQNQVSTKLAEQVLGALHELLRTLHAADPVRIGELAATRPQHLYEGLLATLLRLVFLLYAEDRDLIPTARSGEPMEIYEEGYSVRGLYARLAEDRALHPDTMDERVGGWGRLLALFRLVHGGHPSGWITPRGGKLFDPEAFPFLEGRNDGEPPSAAKVLPIRDGALLRILEGLMTIEARTLGGERVRERVSYRALDVEQVGSVYETVMGFKAMVAEGPSLAIKAAKNNRTPIFVDLAKLATRKDKDRIKYLREEADRGQLSPSLGKAVEAAKDSAELATALDSIVDERASPKKHVIAAGTPILQPTDERRRTGSHYTPRNLTEPIVRHALEPAFERLGSDATPEQILDLKVCDPAMGSAAFLVEACRALAARLVAAWARYPAKKPVIPPDEDEELHARRLVAQRCLYGVDKNPLATDLAKLSLWLATLAREHEFTFLDHALKSGDSLVGLTQAQIAAAHWDTSRPGLPLFRQMVAKQVATALKGRAEIQAAPDDTRRAIQEARHRALETQIKEARLIGDAVIAAFFGHEKREARKKKGADEEPKTRDEKRAAVESWLGASPVAWDKLAAMAATLKQGAHPLTPFHWEIEFPEVFARKNGGFDAIVGNPPFLGGSNISGRLGDQYLSYIKESATGAGNRADLVSYFFQRAFTFLSSLGVAGLIATNTIRQGDTREASTAHIIRNGGVIFRITKRFVWPGEAAVIVSIVHFCKSDFKTVKVIDGRHVNHINSFLIDSRHEGSPPRLAINLDKTYKGLDVYGSGFLFDDRDNSGGSNPIKTMTEIQAGRPASASRIFPYIGGQEINSDPIHAGHRFVFALDDLTETEARQ
jgi:N-6 DNA Methylase